MRDLTNQSTAKGPKETFPRESKSTFLKWKRDNEYLKCQSSESFSGACISTTSITEQYNSILLLENTGNLTSKMPCLFIENHFFCYQNSFPVFSRLTPRSQSLNIAMKCWRTFLLIRSRPSANKGFIKVAHCSKSDQTLMSLIILNKTTERRGRIFNIPPSYLGSAPPHHSVPFLFLSLVTTENAGMAS